MPDTFRCSAASAADDEPLAGTAPTESEWLFVEQVGRWGRKAVTESGLPEEVAAHLRSSAARVQLVRRVSGRSGAGVRVFTATLGTGPGSPTRVRTAVLGDVRDLPGLREADLTAYDGDLWLVCTNGRRDVCCAVIGRPVATALAGRDPEATWETTHLGGHRFAGTLLALPTGLTLGRLNAGSAVAAAEEIAEGRVPLGASRGRAGWPGRAQHADLHLRHKRGWTGLDDVQLGGVEADVVELGTPDGLLAVTVTSEPGPPRRQSCAEDRRKSVAVLRVVDVTTVTSP